MRWAVVLAVILQVPAAPVNLRVFTPPPAEVCGNGIDDDKDGQVDEGCAPPPVEVCGDQTDNDGDGLVDEGCTPLPVPSGDHGYFETLVKHPAFLRGYSLRPKAGEPAGSVHDERQLRSRLQGGLHASGSCPGVFVYDPVMDAAKAPIAPFQEPGVCEGHPLTTPMAASTPGAREKISITGVSSTYGPSGQRQMQIEDEILELRICGTDEGGDGLRAYITGVNVVCVIRGQFGTTATSHAAGIKPKLSSNQINNYLRLPLPTEDGNVYFVTWEGYWTDSYLGIGKWDGGQKTFQFTSQGESKLLEPKLWFDTQLTGFDPAKHVSAIMVRSYNSPNTGQATWPETNGNTMGPGFPLQDNLARTGDFFVTPNRWVRWFVRIDQRANDWDVVDLWVADRDSIVRVLSRVPMSIGKSLDPAKQTLSTFWFEQANSNTAFKRGGVFDLVAYFRNWVVLKNPGDVAPLLVKPQ